MSLRDQMLTECRARATGELYAAACQLAQKRPQGPADGLAFAVVASVLCERFGIDAQAAAQVGPRTPLAALTSALLAAGWDFN